VADAPRPPALLVGYPVLLVTAQALKLAPTEWSNEVFKALLCAGRMGESLKDNEHMATVFGEQ
jgi:hypothetical protein